MKISFRVRCLVVTVFLICNSCISDKKEKQPIPTFDWSDKKSSLVLSDSLNYGKSYLSVYSQIYSNTEHTTLDLTATVSIRNTSELNAISLLKANYYDTEGNLIHNYVKEPISLKEMETLEIVIAEVDKKGGTGANFIFEWATTVQTSEPIFEAVMISTYGQQGLSFMTHGKRIK